MYVIIIIIIIIIIINNNITTIIISIISKVFKYRKQCGMSVSSTSGLPNFCDEVSAVLVLLQSRKHNGLFLRPGHRCMVKC